MDRRLAVSILLTAVLVAVSFAVVLGGGSGTPPPAENPALTPNSTSSGLPPDPRPREFGAHDVRRHFARLGADDYALVSHHRDLNGTTRAYRVRSSLGSERLSATLDSANLSTTRYVENGTLYERTTRNGTTVMDSQNLSLETGGFSALHRRSMTTGVIRLLPGLGNYTRAETVTRNGTRFHRYTLTDLAVNRSGDVNVTDSGAVVLVDDRDVIRHVTIHTTGTRNGTSVEGRVTYDVRAVGNVTVERPSWVTADGRVQTESG